MFINVNSNNEITEVFGKGHIDISASSIPISKDDFEVIKLNGYKNCIYISGKVVFSQLRVDAVEFENSKYNAEKEAFNNELNIIVMERAQAKINRIRAAKNVIELKGIR